MGERSVESTPPPAQGADRRNAVFAEDVSGAGRNGRPVRRGNTEPSFFFRISPRLISVPRRPSDSCRLSSRLISEGRIPGFARINASVLSRSLSSRPCFAGVADRGRPRLLPVERCDVRFIAIVRNLTKSS